MLGWKIPTRIIKVQSLALNRAVPKSQHPVPQGIVQMLLKLLNPVSCYTTSRHFIRTHHE